MREVVYAEQFRAELCCVTGRYSTENKELGRSFIKAVENAVSEIQNDPLRWRAFDGRVRRYLVRRFPYIIYYLDWFSKRLSKKIGERGGIKGKARALAAIFNSGQASNAAICAVPPPRFLTSFLRASLVEDNLLYFGALLHSARHPETYRKHLDDL